MPTVKGAFKGKVWNYPELSREVVEVGSSVLSRYSRPQSQILLELRNSLDFLALTFPTARLESVRRIGQQHLPHWTTQFLQRKLTADTVHKNLKMKINKFTSNSLCNCLDNPQTVSSKVTVLKPRHVSNPNKNLIITFITSKATTSFSHQNNAMLVKLRSLLASQMIRKRVGISSGHSWEFSSLAHGSMALMSSMSSPTSRSGAAALPSDSEHFGHPRSLQSDCPSFECNQPPLSSGWNHLLNRLDRPISNGFKRWAASTQYSVVLDCPLSPKRLPRLIRSSKCHLPNVPFFWAAGPAPPTLKLQIRSFAYTATRPPCPTSRSWSNCSLSCTWGRWVEMKQQKSLKTNLLRAKCLKIKTLSSTFPWSLVTCGSCGPTS